MKPPLYLSAFVGLGAAGAFCVDAVIAKHFEPSQGFGAVWFFFGSAALAFSVVINVVTKHYLGRANEILKANEECEARCKRLIQQIEKGEVR